MGRHTPAADAGPRPARAERTYHARGCAQVCPDRGGFFGGRVVPSGNLLKLYSETPRPETMRRNEDESPMRAARKNGGFDSVSIPSP